MKKDYLKPAMQVVTIHQGELLLTGSNDPVQSVNSNLVGDDTFTLEDEGLDGEGR